MSRSPVFRFAPSPTGELHLGHAFSALVTANMATTFGGRLLLRIEDIDIGRCRPAFEVRILDDLAWLGLEWEVPVRRQSQHFATYAEALAKLEALDVLYPCFATRKEIAEACGDGSPRDPDGALLYPGLYRNLAGAEAARRKARGEPFALRLHMERALAAAAAETGGEIRFRAFEPDGATRIETAAPRRWGDVVIARKDVPASYHLAVVADDALQGVTHVTRGRDLLAATDVHRLLQILLGLPAPLYHHHELIRDERGRKLSKRHGDRSLSSLRKAGVTPEEVRRLVGLGAG